MNHCGSNGQANGPYHYSSMRRELIDLSHHLRQERLYVQHEKRQLQELNEKLLVASQNVAHASWIAQRQRENLDGLLFASRGRDLSPTQCCLRANALEQTIFQDAYKQLSHHEAVYSEFLTHLRLKWKLLAKCLHLGDSLALTFMPQVCGTIFSGLYANCVMTEDENLVMKLLKHLLKTQLASSTNPRKILRQGNCAFSRIYKAFSEGLFSARLFLTSALYEPILTMLSDDEMFLDIDPTKTVIRFPAKDRLNKFGAEGSPEYADNVKQHREFVIGKLEAFTNGFIQGIRDNLHCFPPSLARLLRIMRRMLMSSGHNEPREVYAICVDVIFYLFICPALVDPNPLGIIDTPISYIARSNLMQVAQILQVLALWKWEEIDPRLMDLYSRFDKEALSSVVESMLEMSNESTSCEDDGDEEEEHFRPEEENADESHARSLVEHSPDTWPWSVEAASLRLSRLSVLFTRTQLSQLISFLRTIRTTATTDLSEADEKSLSGMLDPLPANVPGTEGERDTHKFSLTSSVSAKTEESLASVAKKQLSHKLSSTTTKVTKQAHSALAQDPMGESNSSSMEDCDGSEHSDAGSTASFQAAPEVVLVIPLLSQTNHNEPPGFLSEEHVMSHCRHNGGSRVVRMNLTHLPGSEDDHVGGGGERSRRSGQGAGSGEDSVSAAVGEKRTRFSLSHDDGSIGNTSDNLEAISEAASNHSVDSSLEDEVDAVEDPVIDNLSDMVSANVSGRGTPNVSGRDTPSSQVTEGDELAAAGSRPDDEHGTGMATADANAMADPPLAELAERQHEGVAHDGNAAKNTAGRRQAGAASVANRRPNGQSDLEEKFGRFEIKPQSRPSAGHSSIGLFSVGIGGSEQGDETVSLISDTWSTDVLASDTEALNDSSDQHHSRRHQNVRPGIHIGMGITENELELASPPGSSNRATTGHSSALSSAPRLSDGNLMTLISVASSSNVLDVSETASEAWSIDVLASDTDSLRLAELDNEDTASVARSDDTRFTDDTTRSDPEPSVNAASHANSLSQSANSFSPFGVRMHRRDDVTQSSSSRMAAHLGLVSSSAESSRPFHAGTVEQWANQSSSGSRGSLLPRRGSESSTGRSLLHDTQASKHKSPADSQYLDEASKEAEGSRATAMTSNLSATSFASSTESSLGEYPAAQSSGAKPADGGAVDTAATRKSIPRISSTGAIPKSISFDKSVLTAISSSQPAPDCDEQGTAGKHFTYGTITKNRMDKSFLKSWKLPKIGRNRNFFVTSKSSKSTEEDGIRHLDLVDHARVAAAPVCEAATTSVARTGSDDVEDILAKYQSKKKTSSETRSANPPPPDQSANQMEPEEDSRLRIDPDNLEACYAFQDAKRKLRMMLSEADVSMLCNLPVAATAAAKRCSASTDLMWLLRVQLAEAHNLQNRNLVAQLHETLRCLSIFDADGCRKLIRSLQEDYRRRSPYLTYLVRCRQGLLTALAHQERLVSRMELERKVCRSYLVSVCMNIFLEHHEKRMTGFVADFKNAKASDEKVALMESFLNEMWKCLETDKSSLMWSLLVSESQQKLCRVAIERAVVSQIYVHALYPNGEADVSRDEVLSEHIRRLSLVITPGHSDLRIPHHYHYEQPWPSAQAEIRRLAAYKTPQDKVNCVVRCCQTIMNLLSLAASCASKSVPAADDFIPVMVFILIKANPASLLSTVQYVDSFYGNRLSGEDQYWWLQFASAIEFIKTMDYHQ